MPLLWFDFEAQKCFAYYLLQIKQDFGFNFIGSQIREYAVRFSTVLQKDFVGSIELGSGWIVEGLPESLHIKNDFLTYEGSYEVDDGRIHFTISYKRYGTNITTEEYGALRESLIKIDNFVNTPLILRKRQ